MNKDTIIRLAREAGYGEAMSDLHAPALERFAALVIANNPPQSWMSYQEGYEAGQQAGRLAEREACAKVCEARYMGDNNREDMEAKRCAAAIRSRT